MGKKKTILVTGGCGFIGTNLIRKLLNDKNNYIVNIDKITYASNQQGLKDIDTSNYILKKIDIANNRAIRHLILTTKPDCIFHLAAETHVDRSIDTPNVFISSNVLGTYNLLTSSYEYWAKLSKNKKNNFRFIHISTDEVYGSLKDKDPKFKELNRYKPNSPYSASKASADHLVRAWHMTYGLPTIITNTCNNYGPFQFPEKLIPLVINKCLNNKDIPVYGNGKQIRDWIYVDDHISALLTVLKKGKVGDQYNIGSNCELKNINVIKDICKIMDSILPKKKKYSNLIKSVQDRPGHDYRYAINNNKIRSLGWKPKFNWVDGLKQTVTWYLDNRNEILIKSNIYSGERLGKL